MRFCGGSPSKNLTGKLPEGESLVCEDLETLPLCANPYFGIHRFIHSSVKSTMITLPRFVSRGVLGVQALFIKLISNASRVVLSGVLIRIRPV